MSDSVYMSPAAYPTSLLTDAVGGGLRLPCGALIDDEDWWVIAWGKWSVPKTGGWAGYAVTTTERFGKKQTLALHRIVMRAEPSELIDHRNGKTLDDRKDNLRSSDKKVNAYNMRSSKHQKIGRFKGVFRSQTRSVRWRAQIGITEANGKLKQYHLGSYGTEEEAARAYDAKALELFGDAAALNFEVDK
jgi:hypothetical protein